MVNNDNKFNGPTVYIQVINYNNFTTPVVPTIPKNDGLILIGKVMPYVLSFIKWVVKIVPLIIPLHSG